MAINYSGITIATMTLKQTHKNDGKTYRYRLEMRRANCLCCIISVTKNEKKEGEKQTWTHQLMFFAGDETHMKRICNAEKEGGLKGCFWGELENIKFNLYYEECRKLIKYFTQAGYKVTAFWKEPKVVKSKLKNKSKK